MAANHFIVPTGVTEKVTTVRLGAGNTASDRYSDVDQGKLVKYVAESRYDLCAAGDAIEGVVVAVETATSGGYSIGGIVKEGMIFATADGLQATAGTGTIAVGDYVVAGTATAKDTALTAYPKVCKATVQPTTAIVSTVATADTAAAVKVALDAVLATAAIANRNAIYAWKVVSLGQVGTGAVGTTIVIERVSS